MQTTTRTGEKVVLEINLVVRPIFDTLSTLDWLWIFQLIWKSSWKIKINLNKALLRMKKQNSKKVRKGCIQVHWPTYWLQLQDYHSSVIEVILQLQELIILKPSSEVSTWVTDGATGDSGFYLYSRNTDAKGLI
jgi:hypothetical protein